MSVKKILLIIPPHTNPVGPTLGIAVLASFIKKKCPGFVVDSRDLGVESIYYLLSEKNINKIYNKICKCIELYEAEEYINYSKQKHLKHLLKAKAVIEEYESYIEDSIEVLKSEELFADHQRRENAVYIVNAVLNAVGSVYKNTMIHCGDYRTEFSPFSLDDIERYVKKENNLYTDFFNDWMKTTKLEEYSFIGFSVSFAKQILPTLWLAKRIKEKYSKIVVQIGGSMMAHMNEDFFGELFDYCDCIVQREGEYPLYNLLKVLDKKERWSDEIGIIYRADNGVVFPKTMPKVNLDDTDIPDFSGIDLEKYLVPRPVIPYQIGRSCYWGKCSFCCLNTAFVHKNCFHSATKVVDDLVKISERYRVNAIEFVDDAIPPQYAKIISEQLIERQVAINWFGYARFDENFNIDVFEMMQKAGCVGIKFGLESASNRILKKMNKGIDIIVARRLFSEASKAGIIPQAAFFLGFPSEDESDIQRTIQFIKESVVDKGIIAYNGEFRLLKSMPLINSPEEYGISSIDKWNNNEELMDYFVVTLDYDVKMPEIIHRCETEIASVVKKDLVRSVDLRRYWFGGYTDMEIQENVSGEINKHIFYSNFQLDKIQDYQDKKRSDFMPGKGIYSKKSYIADGLHCKEVERTLNRHYLLKNEEKLNAYRLKGNSFMKCTDII